MLRRRLLGLQVGKALFCSSFLSQAAAPEMLVQAGNSHSAKGLASLTLDCWIRAGQTVARPLRLQQSWGFATEPVEKQAQVNQVQV